MIKVLDLERPHQKYFVNGGTVEVPGASTVSQVGEDASGMTHAAWKLGKAGKDYKTEWKNASDIGTAAHWLIQCHLEGNEPDISAVTEKQQKIAQKVFKKFLKRWETSGLRFVLSELQLASEKYLYGGTLDIIFRDQDGRVGLLDIKSSRGIYTGYLCQLSAYEVLANEHYEEPIERRGIWRFGKGNVIDEEIAWLTDTDVDRYFRKFLKKLALWYDD